MSLSRILVCLSSLVLLFLYAITHSTNEVKEEKERERKRDTRKEFINNSFTAYSCSKKKKPRKNTFSLSIFILFFTSPNCKDKLLHNAKTRPISCLSFLLMKTLNRQRNPLVRSCNNRASLLHHGMTTLNYSHDGHLMAGMPTREKTPNVDDFRFEHL